MSVGQCPSCGAPVDFRPGAGQVKVCEHCNTVVFRGELKLENFGKVAQLVDTESPLRLGLFGKYAGTPFTVVGRLQKDNGAGTWDEWCLSFDDGRTAWLSESEGDWNVMFPVEGVKIPAHATLRPGNAFTLRDSRFIVEENNFAKTVSAQGQLPSFHPEHPYVDATGKKGIFASLDFGGTVPEAYVGNRVSIAQLGFDLAELQPQPRKESLRQAKCTQCGGPLDLKAPDATKRVACPYCGALLDVRHGQLAFLELLKKPPVAPVIPLGSKGRLFDKEWTVIAFLVRSCQVEGVVYPWEEYLLYQRTEGFRWLMRANGHWTFLTPIAAGDVEVQFKTAKHEGFAYTLFQEVNVTTDHVLGECYWAVAQNERAYASEFVGPPCSINIDRTENEVTFTKGELLAPEKIQEAFKLKSKLPAPTGIAPAQLNPHKEKVKEGFTWAGIWAVAMVAVFIAFAVISTHGEYLSYSFTLPHGAAPASPEAQTFSEEFVVPVKTPLEVKITGPTMNNAWAGVQCDLVHEETGEVVSVYGELSDYAGVDDGESWTERTLEVSKQTAEVPPGKYILRTTTSFDPGKMPDLPFAVKVSADQSPNPCCLFVFLLLLLAGPIFTAWRSSAFETTRWNDSVIQLAELGRNAPAPRRRREPIELPEDDE